MSLYVLAESGANKKYSVQLDLSDHLGEPGYCAQ